MIKTKPLGMTEDNFCAVINGAKTETRRMFDGSDKPKYNVGDRCYLTEVTAIENAPDQSLYWQVKYFWHNQEVCQKLINLEDKTKIESRKSGINSKQIARFMLKSFARYWVEITDVKLERLLDITAEAAIAEGVKSISRSESTYPMYYDYYTRNGYIFTNPIDSYISEIEMLHSKAIAQSNPWLWVYKFKLCH